MKLPPGDTYADHYCTACGAPFFGPPCGCDAPVTCAGCGNEPDACECECADCGTLLGYDPKRTRFQPCPNCRLLASACLCEPCEVCGEPYSTCVCPGGLCPGGCGTWLFGAPEQRPAACGLCVQQGRVRI